MLIRWVLLTALLMAGCHSIIVSLERNVSRCYYA